MAFETDLIRRYTGAFTKNDCERIIDGVKFFEENNLLFYDKNILDRQDHKVINVTHEYNFSMSSRICDEMFPKLKPCVDEYLKAFRILGQRKFLIHDCKVKKIKCGGGFHAWHYENGTVSDARRTFVIQIYLNDDFDGGETEFLYQNKREKAVAGDVLIFPCQYTHVHRGNPPIDGDKYLVTSWAWIQSKQF